MKLLIVLTCFLVGCLAHKPLPCTSPPLLTGSFSVSSQNEKLWAYSPYIYDALGQRLRIKEIGTYNNKSFSYDALLLFRENAIYQIFKNNRTCKKSPFKADFQPLGVPNSASLLGQFVLGSSSGPGEGLLVNSWTGKLPDIGVEYLYTFTEFGCIPVSTVYHTVDYGWMLTSFFNNVIGITDPSQLNPPDFCLNAKMEESTAELKNFITLFLGIK
ncbi:ependymin-like 1 [Echeneis naucrates]|uniref:Ependymin-like n=1 Tax=Echeneis naucrates TaxID=173247 RepID=A0A665THC6_ECHNA|nr:ependymin-like [Echeneis naucrates]